MSLAKTLAIMYGTLGVLAGLMTAMSSVIFANAFKINLGVNVDYNAKFIEGLGALAIIALPVFTGITSAISGFIAGLVVAWIFNVIVRFSGGIRLEIVQGQQK